MSPRKLSVLVAALGSLLVLYGTKRSGGGAPRVILIGIDGAEMEIIDRLVAAGRLPTFARLKREGASGRLRSVEPLLSPIVWTSIVTGRRPEDHGVFDFVEITPSGEAAPITSARRKVPALWNLAGAYGRSSGFIGWYASYPAEKVNGFTVSDRLAFHQVKSALATEGATFPEALAGELAKELGAAAPDLAATSARFLSDPSAPLSADGRKRLGELAKIHATTELYRKMAASLQRRHHPELLGVYFELLDAASHLFMEDAPPRRPGVTDADFRAFTGTVDRAYEYQDEVLAELLKLEGEETVTIICSDHGFKSGAKRPRTSGRADVGQAPLWHLLYGTLFMHGRPIGAGRPLSGATVLDVAPTALAWLSIPLSRELPGRVLAAAFVPGVLGATASVDRYAPAPTPRAPARPLTGDAEAVEKLAALGYLSGAGKRFPHDADGRTATSHLNEGSARASAGDESGALRAFGKATELDPSNVNALVHAARIYTSRGELARAKQLLDRASAIKPDETPVRLQRAALLLDSGDDAGAAAELAAAERIDADLPLVHLLKARVADRAGRAQEALAELDRAQKLTDSDALLANALALEAEVATRIGRIDLAEAALRRAGSLLPEAALLRLRADLAMARREPAAAAELFRKAVAVRPADPSLLRRLGKALAASGDLPGAEAAFQKAVEKAREADREGSYGDLSTFYQFKRDEAACLRTLGEGTRAVPDSALLWAALGAAYGRASRLDDALAAYERSVALTPTPLTCKTLAALVFELKHDTPRAVALWKKSLELEPGQRDVEAFLKRFKR